MRRLAAVALPLVLGAATAFAQSADSSRTFFTRRDLGIAGAGLGATLLLSHWDPTIARWSQQPRFHDTSTSDVALKISKVNETSLTALGIVTWGVGRLTGNATVADVGLHATEAVVLASLASQVIRGPLGRTRPYVTHDSNAYDFHFMKGFQRGEEGFKHRAFPSIHTSSAMAVATVLTLETNRRRPSATKFVAPVAFGLLALPGLARIQLDQHWASDILAGGVMGVIAGWKVTSYSHDHPGNLFDRTLLRASVIPNTRGGFDVGLSVF